MSVVSIVPMVSMMPIVSVVVYGVSGGLWCQWWSMVPMDT